MPLCDLCKGLSIDKLFPPSIYHHVDNMAALEASAATCRLCKLIHWSIERGWELEHHPQLEFEGVTEEMTKYGEFEARNACSVKLQIVLGSWDQLLPQSGFLYIGVWMMSKWMCADLKISVEEGDELGLRPAIDRAENSYITSRVLVSEQPPQAQFDVAKGWLDHCTQKHSLCAKMVTKMPQLPSRVINVTAAGQDPYLMDGNEQCASYASLSHCWGATTMALTTKNSLLAHQSRLSLEALPKTFREAILVCRQLAIPYLWIDSLCIIQDDQSDWERHSGDMGSIYQDSTLVIAATDSLDSSKGLFLPRRPNEHCYADIITLPKSFGHGKGQAYITQGGWGTTGPPASDMQGGILQTRGWAMQERFLAPRTLHFLSGQMVWECCEQILGQGGFKDSFRNSWRKNPRNQMKTFTVAFDRPYRFAGLGDDDSDDGQPHDSEAAKPLNRPQEDETVAELDKIKDGLANAEIAKEVPEEIITSQTEADEEDDDSNSERSALVTMLIPPDKRASNLIDLRDVQYQTSITPTPVTREASNELYNFLDVASRHTIYHAWYEWVGTYSCRWLTFPTDKLPALAGIASRVQAITKDQYLAGHWRRELERSLFWTTTTEAPSCTPARVMEYRAPSWSWASVEGPTSWRFADLAPGNDSPAPIEILDAGADVDGENPFGRVKSGRIVIKARVVRALWDAEKKGWTLPGTFTAFTKPQYGDLVLFNSNESTTSTAGLWHYDDVVNGIMPGPRLATSDTDESVRERVVPSGYYFATSAMNNIVHGNEFMDTPLSQRGTYVPAELVLVRGPTIYRDKWDDPGSRNGKDPEIDILVLEKEKRQDVYRRVGAGRLRSWDEEVQSIETLTVI